MHPTPARQSLLSAHLACRADQAGSIPTTCRTSAAACLDTPPSSCNTSFVSFRFIRTHRLRPSPISYYFPLRAVALGDSDLQTLIHPLTHPQSTLYSKQKQRRVSTYEVY